MIIYLINPLYYYVLTSAQTGTIRSSVCFLCYFNTCKL